MTAADDLDGEAATARGADPSRHARANVLAWSVRQARERLAAGSSTPPDGALSDRGRVEVPEDLAQRFVRRGPEYRFADGTLAFVDRGTSLVTPSASTEVVRTLLGIAEARGWSELLVHGSERFRREAWSQAAARGLAVRGYAPDEAERARVARREARDPHEPAKSSVPSAPQPSATTAVGVSPPDRRPVRGTLLEHGSAPYQHDPEQPESYFVRIATARGSRTLWGVDLERALRESVSQPILGEQIVLRRMRQEPVTIRTRAADEDGAVTEFPRAVLRNRWSLESRAFVRERAAASAVLRDSAQTPKDVVRDRPELAGAYVALRGAELLAAERLPHAVDRGRFVARVREALAARVERGDPWPTVRLRTRTRRPDRESVARESGPE